MATANAPRGKIKKPLCESVQKNIVRPNLAGNLQHSYQTYLDLNKAHVVMIAKQKMIKPEVAKAILKVQKEMSEMGDKPTFFIDPKLEGLYFNLEKYLIDRIGIDLGGQMHTARSRNDMDATVTRIDARRNFFEVCAKFIEMRKTLISLAERNLDAVMAGYTHLQPSEPITFGHYCSAMASAFERDYKRIAAAYETINVCPMGCGSMGSTTWDIDRPFTAELLGFDKPMDNSVDAIGSRDFALELLTTMAIAGNTFSRFCHDMYVWSTPEFGYVEVDDSVAICSSIMPQKKNPYTFEYIKGKSGSIEGFSVGSYSAMKNTPYTNVTDVSGDGTKYLLLAMEQMIGCCELLRDTIKDVTVKKDRMLENALGNFCTVTELANSLVRIDHISFRAAHEIVALVVDYMINNKLKANQIKRNIVNKFFRKLFQQETVMTDEQISLALDPTKVAYAKTIIGGSAPKEVKRQLAARKKQLKADEEELAKRVKKVAAAKKRLEQEVAKLIK